MIDVQEWQTGLGRGAKTHRSNTQSRIEGHTASNRGKSKVKEH